MNADTRAEAARHQGLAAYWYARAQCELLKPRTWHEEPEAAARIARWRSNGRAHAMIALCILTDDY